MSSITEIINSFASNGVIGAIAILLILVFATVIGLFRKTFMSIWDLLLFVALFVVSYFVLMPRLGDWICDKFMLQFGINSTINVNGIDVYRIDSFGDLIKFMCMLANDVNATEEYAYNLAHSICYALALSCLSLCVLIVTPLLSLLTWPLVKLAIPKKLNHLNFRIIGPIVSILETLFVLVVLITSFGAYSSGFKWMLDNPDVLSTMGVPMELFGFIKIFTKDFFGFFKYLDFNLIKFQFAANGTIYNTAEQMEWLAQKVIPADLEGDAVEALSDLYKSRLLEIWLMENEVSIPTK